MVLPAAAHAILRFAVDVNISVFAGASVALALVTSIPIASAQNTNAAGNGLQISPTRTEISALKGEQKSFTIQLKNITKVDLRVKAILNDFESDEVSGTPKIIADTTVRTTYSVASMLKGLKDVDLKAGEQKELEFAVDVPGNAVPGAYFGAIRYQVVPNDAAKDTGNRQVALNASVAHLLFVEVPGEITERINLESVKIQKDTKASSLFFSSPNKSAVAVKNLGNGFSRPFGKVAVSYFGKEVYGYDLNNGVAKSIVLPNSVRTFTDDIKNISKPGKYNVVASVAYGNGGEVVNYRTSFWYIPFWFIAVVLSVFALIAGASYITYRRRFSSSKRKK